jgi:hypothetical protein
VGAGEVGAAVGDVVGSDVGAAVPTMLGMPVVGDAVGLAVGSVVAMRCHALATAALIKSTMLVFRMLFALPGGSSVVEEELA